MKQLVLILLLGIVFAVQLLSATRITCGDHWYSHRCGLQDWNANCSSNLNLTLNYSHLYHGDESTITTEYDGLYNDTLTYFICLRRYIPKLKKFFYNSIACVESNNDVISVPWRWSFHGNATIFANVYSYNNVFDIFSLACARTNVTIGRRLPLNISVSITEEGHDEQYSQFVPGNISIIVSADMPNRSNQSSNTSSIVVYSYSLILLDLETGNFTHRYELSNDSSVEYIFEFTDPVGYSYDVSMTANDSTNSILYSSESSFGQLVIVEPVGYPAITVNRNQTASRGSSVDVEIAVNNGSLPITVCWNLSVHPSAIPLNNQSDPNKPSQPIVAPYHFKCNSTINCTTFNTDSTYKFIFNCTFNSTGNYQLMALFNNSASAGKTLYNFSVSEPPTPPVVATSTSAAVIAVIVIVIGVLILLAIALYIPYYRYKNRFTETANFSFVRLRRPSKWEHLKSQVDQLKDRVLRRQSKVGLVNVNDDPLTSSYGSIDHFDTHESL